MGESELRRIFAAQLLKAYKGWQQKDIAEDLGISQSKLSKVLNFEQRVDAEIVISVSEKRGCTTDWLLKGEGEGPVSILDFLGPAEKAAVEALAGVEGRDVEGLISELVGEALGARAAEMLRNRRGLMPTELRKLRALMKLVDDDNGAAEADRPAGRRAR